MDYPDEAALAPELKQIIEEKKGANVYRMLTHSPHLAPGVTLLSDAVMWNESWPAGWRELAIVRVGHHHGAPYEIYHHERIGRMVGLNNAQLTACAIGADQSALSVEERRVLELTDLLVRNRKLSDIERTEALDFLNPNQLVDLVLTVGYYQMVCAFLNTFEVQIESEGDLAPGGAHLAG